MRPSISYQMGIWSAFVIATLTSVSPLPVNSHPGSPDGFSGSPARRLQRRNDNDLPDSEDHSYTTGFAGIGDSFPAGLGTGSQYDNDTTCARGDCGYPNLINQDERMGDPAGRTFQFLACSGAKSKDVLANQVPELGGNQQLITLSAGGNDVGLTDILNACIFQWNTIAQLNCAQRMANSQRIIDTVLSSNLNELYAATKQKLDTDPKNPGKLYVTSYAKYFNANTEQCDSQSWSFWYQDENKQYLIKDTRQKLNDMVDAVNQKISEAVTLAGDQVVFVNWDPYVTRFRGRYCDVNVYEPDASRFGLLFYEWDTIDPGEPAADDPNTELKRSGTSIENGTFGGDINNFVEQTFQTNPDWTYAAPGGTADEATAIGSPPKSNSKGPAGNCQVGTGQLAHVCTGDIDTQLGVISYLPTTWLRIFHPRPSAHAMIANLILYYMYVDRAKFLNQQPDPEVNSMTVCAIDPAPTMDFPSPAMISQPPVVASSLSLSCTSPSTLTCATFNHKAVRAIAPATTKAPGLGRRQNAPVPFHSNPPNASPAGPATTCSCTV